MSNVYDDDEIIDGDGARAALSRSQKIFCLTGSS